MSPRERHAQPGTHLSVVMPGLVPGIHVVTPLRHCDLCSQCLGVDGRDKPGHDVKGREQATSLPHDAEEESTAQIGRCNARVIARKLSRGQDARRKSIR